MSEGSVWFFPFEEQLIVWLQHLGEGTALQSVLRLLNNIFSFFGEEIICIAVLGMIYWGFDKRKGERIAAAILSTAFAIGMVKNVFSRLRPWIVSDRISLLRDVDGFSFPSGHSANSTSLYPTTAMEYRNIRWFRWLAVCIPLLVGISRCYLGAHWPTDVLVGWAVGLVFFAIAEFGIAKHPEKKYRFYMILLLISAAGIFYCRTNDYFTSFGMFAGFVAGLKFEESHVNFQNTDNIFRAALRTVVGGVLYLGITQLLKPVLGNLFAEASLADFLMRSLRYGVAMFLVIGIYPMIFRKERDSVSE